jgi:hypothetical protein
MSDTRNSKVLRDFVAYCEAHPTDRFWQALRNWSGHSFIYAVPPTPTGEVSSNDWEREFRGACDTFYWEHRNR